ncbi:MAG: thermonuclease family protein [Rhizobiales bacterium]|nr:thermonuclease family protein [Hyphomicrobiales bacterium]
MRRARNRRSKSPPLVFLVLLVLGLLLIGYIDQTLREIHAADGSVVLVRDGDSLAIDRAELRLYGIDAPELRQTCADAKGEPWRCGEAAKSALNQIVSRGGLRCSPRARDRFGREVATCRVNGLDDVGAAMLRDGFAVVFGTAPDGDYQSAETAARVAKRGIWQGGFMPPSEWRHQHPRPDGGQD